MNPVGNCAAALVCIGSGILVFAKVGESKITALRSYERYNTTRPPISWLYWYLKSGWYTWNLRFIAAVMIVAGVAIIVVTFSR